MKSDEFRRYCEQNWPDYEKYARAKEEERSGFVYAIEYQDGVVKIGCTRDLYTRMYQLMHVYRGKEYVIQKIYASSYVKDKRKKEQEVLKGLMPILPGKSECVDITFSEAVARIIKVCGKKCAVYDKCFDDVAIDFPSAVPCNVGYEYHTRKLHDALAKYEMEIRYEQTCV